MTSVFLSGSRKISRLNDAIRSRLQNILDQEFQVFVGDANGADKAMQSFLSDRSYRNVSVFCAGGDCRNNVGSWEVRNIRVDRALKGRAFYTQKDKAMAAEADFGLVLWDGKSEGSINNVFELIRNEKKAVVYLSPRKEFFNVKSPNDVRQLLDFCEKGDSDKLRGSRSLRKQMESLEISEQCSFQL